MNLNDRKYKEFKVSDIFIVKYGVNLELNACEEMNFAGDGIVNFVARTAENNGVSAYVKRIEGVDPQDAGLISVAGGGSVLSTFLQDEPFYSGRDLYTLKAKKNISNEAKMFIISIIEKNKYKYSYGRQANKTLPDLLLQLPVDSNGLPDYLFMEEYIKSLHHKPLTTKNKPKHTPDLNVNQWKTFRVQRTKQQSGLFEIENCKCGSAGELEDGNDINYIGAKKSYNGVMRSVAIDKNLVSRGHGIMFICDGEGSVGYTNYMDEDFIGSTTTSIGYDEALTEKNAMFLVAVLDNEKFKYSYGRKYRAHLIDAVINLPIKHNSDGSVFIDKTHKYSDEGYVPDWQFMEDYIKALPYGDRLKG